MWMLREPAIDLGEKQLVWAAETGRGIGERGARFLQRNLGARQVLGTRGFGAASAGEEPVLERRHLPTLLRGDETDDAAAWSSAVGTSYADARERALEEFEERFIPCAPRAPRQGSAEGGQPARPTSTSNISTS